MSFLCAYNTIIILYCIVLLCSGFYVSILVEFSKVPPMGISPMGISPMGISYRNVLAIR